MIYNVVILGTGIAGCTAAIYAARANLNPLVISGPEDGGQLTLTTEVENFPGFPDGIKGLELARLCKKQAERFGAKFETEIVTDLNKADFNKTNFNNKNCSYELILSSGKKIQTKSLIIATGASARWLGLPSEKKYQGRGVSTCATCDGAFYKNKEIIVVGGGDSAMEESLFLTKFASKITIIHRKESFRASKIMQQRALTNPRIKVIWNSEVVEILGDGKKVTGVKLKDNKNRITEFQCNGVFLAIGHAPNTKIFAGKLNLDEKGYLQADRSMHTNLPGVFAAGDVQDIRYRQAITAAGTGCQAAMEAEKYLAEIES